MLEEKEFQQRMQQFEELIREFETEADPATRDKVAELVRLLMDFHGAGLERMTEIVAGAGEPGGAIFDDFARDALVGSLLLLYGLHPAGVETRVRAALDKVRPLLRTHGGEVELLGVKDGVVRLRLDRGGKGCPSTATSLK
ncbi:MAG: NifU family protein, partial [Pyrinomonadaceae bacterium]